jgi:hypothetical protein
MSSNNPYGAQWDEGGPEPTMPGTGSGHWASSRRRTGIRSSLRLLTLGSPRPAVHHLATRSAPSLQIKSRVDGRLVLSLVRTVALVARTVPDRRDPRPSSRSPITRS